MEIKNHKRRIVDDKIEHYLKLFGAISIEGPKYCGKTWAGRYHSNSEVLLHNTTGELSNNVELAKISPSLILEGEKPKLIDEWQEATNLWDEIRADVDRTGLKGQYILTGSYTPNRKGKWKSTISSLCNMWANKRSISKTRWSLCCTYYCT